MPPAYQNPNMKIFEKSHFDRKELRQIEHFLNREMGEDYYWSVDLSQDCSCDICRNTNEYIEAKEALANSQVYKKLIEMVEKYNLHVRLERDTGRIWATKKGANDVKVQSIQKRR